MHVLAHGLGMLDFRNDLGEWFWLSVSHEAAGKSVTGPMATSKLDGLGGSF